MEDSGRHECESVWLGTLDRVKEILGDDDFEYIEKFRSLDMLLSEVKNLEQKFNSAAICRLLRTWRPQLYRLQVFVTFFIISLGSQRISLALIWGITFLLIQLACESEKALSEISQHFHELAEKLALFEEYTKSMEPDPELLRSFFDVLVDLVSDCAVAIKHFRKNDISKTVTLASWSTVNKQFSKTLQKLSDKIDHLRKLIKARQLTDLTQKQSEMSLKQTEIIQMLYYNNLQSSAMPNTAQLPHYQLPFSRNHAFYGRVELLAQIQHVLVPEQHAPSIRSVALWGTGGIGKSQIALEYANLQMQSNCKLILWIPSETESEITKALVDAAQHIRPPGFEENSSPERTCLVMLNWLQTTETPWLLVFDNVESNELLLQNWPTAGNGQIVVTCRSELSAASPAAQALEIPAFTVADSCQLLMKLASIRDSDSEVEAATELGQLLGGLALAIDITARQILARKKSVKDFLPYFIENRHLFREPPRYSARNPYYSKNLLTVWKTAFIGLSPDSSKLLSLLCFTAPDGIPRDLFRSEKPPNGDWEFLHNGERYGQAEQELLYFSLIRINDQSNMMSIHRLTQEAYYYEISDQDRYDAFCVTYHLLCDAFPKRAFGRHLYKSWSDCERLIHHVATLQDKYEELRYKDFTVQDENFAILMADATWYLSEISSLALGERLGARAAENCADKNSLTYAYICESIATIDHRRGSYENAHKYFSDALTIRQKSTTTTPYVLADSYSAVGLALAGLFRNQEAIESVEKALEIVYSQPEEERVKFNVDRYLRNSSRPKVALRRFDEAREDITKADAYQTKIYGEGSNFHGETAYILGKIAIAEGDFEAASEHFGRAFNLMSVGKPTHQSVAATRYHQGLILLQREGDPQVKDSEAFALFQHSLRICQLNEARRGDQGESARVKWRISEILKRQNRLTEAQTYRTAAEKTKSELEATRLYPTAPDYVQSWDCFTNLLDR